MTTTTYKTPHDISVLGFSALIKDLGSGGAVQCSLLSNMRPVKVTIHRSGKSFFHTSR
jgi:hypothetical protein